MRWEFVIALVIAIPVILFPAAFVWYLNLGGIISAIREARARRRLREKDALTAARPKHYSHGNGQ